jgi:hypothetical protein
MVLQNFFQQVDHLAEIQNLLTTIINKEKFQEICKIYKLGMISKLQRTTNTNYKAHASELLINCLLIKIQNLKFHMQENKYKPNQVINKLKNNGISGAIPE